MTNSNPLTEQELAELERRAQEYWTLGADAKVYHESTPRLIAALREAWWQAQEDDALHEKLYADLAAERDALRAAIRTALAAYHTDPNAFVRAMDELAKLVE